VSRPGRGALATLLALVLCGCGVPLSDVAEPIPGARRSTPSATATPTPTGGAGSATATTTVWYVDGARLVPREVTAPAPASADAALALLGVAPDSQTGLVTLIADPVGGPPLAALPTPEASPSPSLSGGTSIAGPQQVVLSPTFAELTAEQQVLLIGQVVLTLTEIDPSPVVFVDSSGAPLSVPLPDGRLRDGH
jgi:hypothetical protein